MPGHQPARSRPGRKPRLSRDEIIEVALGVLAAEGPDRLSLRRIAGDLDVTPRAIYGHFSSKDDLEAAIVDRVMPALPDVMDPERSWHEQLRDSVLQIQDAVTERPGTSRLFLTASTSNNATNRLREHLLMLLLASGLGMDDVVAAVGSLSRYILGCVAIEDERRLHPEIANPSPSSVDPEEFPLLSAMSERYQHRNRPESARYGLELLILGLRGRTEELVPQSGDRHG